MNIVVEVLLVICQLLWIFLRSIINWILPTRYKNINGEVCLITGAGSGIGRLMAMEFSKRGATLVLWDINEKGNEETADMIKRCGGKAYAFKCDVSNRDEVYEVAEKTRDVAGKVDILVNNAGIVYGKDFKSTSDDEIERTMRVNSMAHFWTVRAFLPDMLERNHGHIVTIASVMGLFAVPGLTTYVASKHASVGFHNALEFDLRKWKADGVNTTLVCPYHIDTGMFKGLSLRFPVLPPLKPEECVDALMHAVLTNQKMIAIPRLMYLFYNVMTWLPHQAIVLVGDFVGSNQAMDKFIPNRDYQHDTDKED